jgi:hypothetical protein
MERRNRICVLVLVAAALTAAGATAAVGAPPTERNFHVVGTPKLYVTSAGNREGGPKVYVVFRSSIHLHEPRLVLAAVKGHNGRTYASRRTGVPNCYLSTAIYAPAKVPITAGFRYRVDFLTRPTSHSKQTTLVTSYHLVARHRSGITPPSC